MNSLALSLAQSEGGCLHQELISPAKRSGRKIMRSLHQNKLDRVPKQLSEMARAVNALGESWDRHQL